MNSTRINGFAIELFDGKGSFTLWQRRVKDILVQQGLAKALDANGKGKMSADDWEQLESKCVSTIRLCIADNIINNVMDEETATGIWKKMEKLYLAKSLTNKWHLKKKLYRLEMAEGMSLIDHMNVFNSLADQLCKVESKVEDKDLAFLLLSSLPSSYDNLVTTLLYGKDSISLEDAQSCLLSHDIQRKSDHGDERDAVLVAGHYQKKKGSVQCYHCKEIGHVKRNCPNRKGKDKDVQGKDVKGVGDSSLIVTHSDDLY